MTTLPELSRTWAVTWLGNLLGSALLGAVFAIGGGVFVALGYWTIAGRPSERAENAVVVRE
jgi:formate/nitrite transporter FocA (FNT family)